MDKHLVVRYLMVGLVLSLCIPVNAKEPESKSPPPLIEVTGVRGASGSQINGDYTDFLLKQIEQEKQQQCLYCKKEKKQQN